jgi:hypothetical protein
MTPTTDPGPTEADDTAAPFAFVYIAGVVAWLAAVLAWVFWFRGYP